MVEDDAAASSAIVRALEGLPMSLVVAPRREALARGGAGERFDIVITSLSQGETQDPYTALAPRRIFLGVGAFDGLGRFVLETPANTALEHPRFLAELRALVSERSQ